MKAKTYEQHQSEIDVKKLTKKHNVVVRRATKKIQTYTHKHTHTHTHTHTQTHTNTASVEASTKEMRSASTWIRNSLKTLKMYLQFL